MSTFSPIQIRCNGATLTIRSATVTDAAQLIELAREVFLTSSHTLTTAAEFTMTIAQESELIETLAKRDNAVFLLASFDNTPVASLILSGGAKQKERHVGTLGVGVHSSARGKGVGTALMQASIDWARNNEVIEMIRLGVYASNTRAFELYKRLGFIQCGMLPGGCKHLDGTYHDQIDMYLWVKPH